MNQNTVLTLPYHKKDFYTKNIIFTVLYVFGCSSSCHNEHKELSSCVLMYTKPCTHVYYLPFQDSHIVYYVHLLIIIFSSSCFLHFYMPYVVIMTMTISYNDDDDDYSDVVRVFWCSSLFIIIVNFNILLNVVNSIPKSLMFIPAHSLHI